MPARHRWLRIRSMQDFYAGLLFTSIGLVGAWICRRYALGTPARMGPGYFPALLSWGTVILGLSITLRSLAQDGDAIAPVVWRPVIFVLAGIAAFALLIKPAGLIVAVIATVIVGGCASRELRSVELFALGVGLALFASLVFVTGLGLNMSLWPQ